MGRTSHFDILFRIGLFLPFLPFLFLSQVFFYFVFYFVFLFVSGSHGGGVYRVYHSIPPFIPNVARITEDLLHGCQSVMHTLAFLGNLLNK